jgi:hypothetical protein
MYSDSIHHLSHFTQIFYEKITLIAQTKNIQHIQTKNKNMKKAFIITIVLLLLLAGCDYDPILTDIAASIIGQGKNTHGLLGLLFIFGPMILVGIVCIWPHKKKLKH